MSGEKLPDVSKTLTELPKDAVIALQETNNPSVVLRIRNLFPDSFITVHNGNEPKKHQTGVITISPEKPVFVRNLDFPRLRGKLWAWLFKKDGSEVPQHRALLTKFLLPDGTELTVVNAHFEVFGGKKHKLQQLLTVRKALEECGATKTIILGDFNTKNVGWMLEVLGQGFRLVGNPHDITASLEHTVSSNLVKHTRALPLITTRCVNIFFDSRRDWMIIKGLVVNNSGVMHEHTGADHYPIWAVLE